SVALCAQQVSGEERLHFQILGARQRLPAPHSCRQRGQQRGDRILLCCPFGEATRQEPEVPAARRPAWQVGKTRVSRVIEPYPEELLQELVALLTHRQVWIKASQQRRPRSGIGPPRPELAHAGLAVQVVPEEDLVRALASEDHFGAARTHQATQQPERRRGRT